MSKNVICLGEDRFNKVWLKSVTEQDAVSFLRTSHDADRVRKAWKIANGLSVPNYVKDAEKPKRKRVKKENDSND